MKKIIVGILCILIAITIAASMVACNGGESELTYSTDSQSVSISDNSDLSASAASDQSSSDTQANPETVLYQLTTKQGETVQVISTTMPLTELSTMNYEPVTVPPMSTTVYNNSNTEPATTAYEAPTYSDSESNKVTTKAATTTEKTTEKKITYISVGGDGGISGDYIKIYADNDFGDKIQSKKGTATINYGSATYKASCSVLSQLYAGEQVEINVGIPSELRSELETSDNPIISVVIPKGLIVSGDNVSNNEFRITIYAEF